MDTRKHSLEKQSKQQNLKSEKLVKVCKFTPASSVTNVYVVLGNAGASFWSMILTVSVVVSDSAPVSLTVTVIKIVRSATDSVS